MATPPSTSAPTPLTLASQFVPRPWNAPAPAPPPDTPDPRLRGCLRLHRVAGRPSRPAGAEPDRPGDRPARRRRGPLGRRTDLPARERSGDPGRAPAWPSCPASAIDRIGHAEVILRSSRLDLRDVIRRPGRGAAGARTCSTTSSWTSKACRSSAPPTSTWPRSSAVSGSSAPMSPTPPSCAVSAHAGGGHARRLTVPSTGPPSSPSPNRARM